MAIVSFFIAGNSFASGSLADKWVKKDKDSITNCGRKYIHRLDLAEKKLEYLRLLDKNPNDESFVKKGQVLQSARGYISKIVEEHKSKISLSLLLGEGERINKEAEEVMSDFVKFVDELVSKKSSTSENVDQSQSKNGQIFTVSKL